MTAALDRDDAPTWHLEAGPLLKWPGGKRSLLPRILESLPARCDRYVEPMVGGGAVFFAYGPNAERVALSDVNAELVSCYNAIAEDPDVVYRSLEEFCEDHAVDPDVTYMRERALFNDGGDDPFEQAARMVYLNRAGYNGLWRVNGDGRYNVPRGDKSVVAIPTWAEFKASAGQLALASIEHMDACAVLWDCGDGDVVYLDPPYPGGFDQYTADGFDDDEHRRLANHAQHAADAGAHVLVSIGDHRLSRELYAEHQIVEVSARGSIGAKAERRGRRAELLITITPRR